MVTDNPFIPLMDFLPPLFLRTYIILMVVAVAVGTLADMVHKGSATFFMQQRNKAKAASTRPLDAGARASLAVRTLLKEVATSGEFHNPKRRISHLLMFYGFLLYIVTTIVMAFGYPTGNVATPALLPMLWNLGAVMILAGGYWFFFFIRVNVAHEGHSPFHLMRADLFIVSLLTSVSFALLWEIVQAAGGRGAAQTLFGLYLFFTTLLFVSVPWSKFAHMFYKPAAAFQRRVEEADGSSTLPAPSQGPHKAV